MAQFADGILAHEVGRTVLNRTGLNGVYDLTLTWVPDHQSKNPLAGDENDVRVSVADTGPSIYNALPDQLGLKLVPAKGPVDILVIDHIEKPSAN